MSWSFEYFRTDPLDAEIDGNQSINSIIRRFSFEETVGDEFENKAGDLSLMMIDLLPYNGSYYNWLAAYYQDTLYNVYYIGSADDDLRYYEFDVKNKIYKVRLKPIQGLFYEHLRDTVIADAVQSRMWGFNLGVVAKVIIEKIRESSNGSSFILNRWGFSLGDILTNLQSTGDKTNQYGYYISNYSLPDDLYLKNSNDLPIIFRGLSEDESVAAGAVIASTFTDYNVSWLNIFKIAIFAFNCFLYIIPKIISGKLAIEFHFIPRIYITGTGQGATWIERKFDRFRYKIDGVHLKGINFEYSLGNIESRNLFDRDIDIGNPDTVIAQFSETLFCAGGDYISANDQYDILDDNEYNVGFFTLDLSSTYYQDMIDSGHGYSGKILFNGERVLDKLSVGSDIFQITRLNINENNEADIEGIIL